MEDFKAKFLAVGIVPNTVDNIVKNKKVSERLAEVLNIAGVKECDRTIGNLLYALSTKLPEQVYSKTNLVTELIVSLKVKSNKQLDAAINYLKVNSHLEAINQGELETASGVGVVVTPEEIKELVAKLFAENAAKITELKHSFNFSSLILAAQTAFPWAEDRVIVSTINEKKLEMIGEEPKGDGKRKKTGKGGKKAEEEDKKEEETKVNKISQLVARDMHSMLNSEEILKKVHGITGGRVLTRFPPEPNGYLHIGHAKAMKFNFDIAKDNGGDCYLRFDDTNPCKENQEFIDHIKKNVEWLGYKPWKVTHASEYFQELYDLGCELIRRGKAYVCHQSKEQMNEGRRTLLDSPYRNRPVDENLKLFQKMKQGRFEENECCLRMKIDMQHVNPCMRDPVAFRIRYHPHPHSGDKWCVYPTYDYTHCINDSLEYITHSLCTLEFEVRRDSYYWLLEALDLYRPYVWEYSRLNITYNVLSKRKLQILVEDGHVRGWDDPRLLTLEGLKRRGYTPSILDSFCAEIGVARKGNENFTSMKLLEYHARQELDITAPRTFAVCEPILLEIVNLEEVKPEETKIESPIFPMNLYKGTQTYNLTANVFIERDDFEEVDRKGFFGLTPTQMVRLRYGPVVKLEEIVKDQSGNILKLKVRAIPEHPEKLKGVIQWVSKEHSVNAVIRLYSTLFTEKDPMSFKDKWLSVINPEGLVEKVNGKVWDMHKDVKQFDRFQFERVGYFVVDKDNKMPEVGGKLVFNRIVELRESKEKKENMGVTSKK